MPCSTPKLMKLFGNISHEPSETRTAQPAICAQRRQKRAERLVLRRRHRLAGADAGHEQRDDAGALHGPERIAVEVLVDEAEVVEVESRSGTPPSRRSPGRAARRGDRSARAPRRPKVPRRAAARWAVMRLPAQRAASGTQRVLPLQRAPSVKTPGPAAHQRPRGARQRRAHRDLGEDGGDAQATREATAPERLVGGDGASLRRRGGRAGRRARAAAGPISAARTNADCSAMLIPSPTIGCASPAALPMRKTPSRWPRRTPGRSGPLASHGAFALGAGERVAHARAFAAQHRLDDVAGARSAPARRAAFAADRRARSRRASSGRRRRRPCRRSRRRTTAPAAGRRRSPRRESWP